MCLVFIYLFYFHLEIGRDKKGFVFVKENGYGKRGPPWIFFVKDSKMEGITLVVVKKSKNEGDHS